MSNERKILEIPVSKISYIPFLKRKWIDPVVFTELCESVKSSGVIQPIIVRRSKGAYELISGERRFKAAVKVGLQLIPCIVRRLGDKEAILLMLNEKLQHEEINPFDAGLFIKLLIDSHQMGVAEVAEKIGKSKGFVNKMILLLTVCEHLQRLVYEKKLPYKQACILADHKEEEQIELAHLVIDYGLTERELVVEVAKRKTKKLRGSSRNLSGVKISLKLENHLVFLDTIEANLHNISDQGKHEVIGVLEKIHEKTRTILEKISGRKEVMAG